MEYLGTILEEHSVNPVHETEYETDSDKKWVGLYHPITNLRVHTRLQVDGSVTATFDGPLHHESADDVFRKSQEATRPNRRRWHMDMESDAACWFNTEVSNVVLAGWAQCPDILQASEMKALSERKIEEVVDSTYSVKSRQWKDKKAVIIGEFKRCLIAQDDWQNGKFKTKPQHELSRELRGYAFKYECPQIFCFDGYTLLLLQFRAATNVADIKGADTPVDCWVIPRQNPGGVTLRYAFYRFLMQGFRRCQGIGAPTPEVGGMRPITRHFFNGRPVWKDKHDRLTYDHPLGFTRDVDSATGAFYWEYQGNPVVTNGSWIWDSVLFWDIPQYVEENPPQQSIAWTGGYGEEIPREELYD